MQFRELTDRYQLQKILKSTRFGTILQATDTRSGQTVAIKLITVPPQPGVEAGAALMAGAPAFQKLAVTLAGLQHPNLPVVLDFGFTTDGSAFLVQEMLEGKTLDTLAGSPPTRALNLVAQALDGLEALASRGLVHHNLSPDNVLVLPDERVKLTGLGAAIFRPRENGRYRAPELAEPGPADWRADIFSLALTACTALGATVGFDESPVVQLPLSVSFELENDEALRQALERSLRRQPGERPTPPQFREALRLALGAAAAAPRQPAVPVAVAPPAPAPPPSNVTPFPTPPAPRPVPVPVAAPAPAASASPEAAALLADLDPLGNAPPAEEEEVLTAVDDEVLNALLAVPAPPPRLPAGAAAAAAQGNVVPFPSGSFPTVAGAPPAAPKPLFRRPAVLVGIAGVLVLGALAVYWFLSRPEPQPEVAAPPPPALPAWFNDPPVEELEEARMYLAVGEDLKARKVLRSIPFGQQGLLSAEACRTLGAIEESLALAGLERLPADLAAGLGSGDFAVLQNAIEVGSGQEAGMTPEVRADFDRARSLVRTYAEALVASERGEHVQVLERLAALEAQLPGLSDPEDLRGKAASALEAQAEELIREARYDAALAAIEPIGRTWSGRAGHEDRVARYQKYKGEEEAQEKILAAIPTAERRKSPEEGLKMLEGVEPTPHLAPRFAEARARLEELLARLDKEAPKVVLRDGYYLEYARGTVAELSFRATDDHAVKDVKIMARAEGGKFRELPAEQSRSFYFTVEIAPDFHKNGTVEIYVVATDLSGHEGYLGSRDQPLVLKRKQGFERLIQ
ncbi:MAG TPA: protein kinase [Thermoanaerobaculia bacterium]|nr:protein kinase [Thermoanaerobaculia bacterium]